MATKGGGGAVAMFLRKIMVSRFILMSSMIQYELALVF